MVHKWEKISVNSSCSGGIFIGDGCLSSRGELMEICDANSGGFEYL